MPLVSMRQLLDHAAENGYGIPAFNVNNLEQVQAIMAAASEVDARFREAAAQIVRYARGFCDESDLPALIRRSLIALSREAPPMVDESAVAPRSVDFAAIAAGEVRNWVRERLLTAP